MVWPTGTLVLGFGQEAADTDAPVPAAAETTSAATAVTRIIRDIAGETIHHSLVWFFQSALTKTSDRVVKALSRHRVSGCGQSVSMSFAAATGMSPGWSPPEGVFRKRRKCRTRSAAADPSPV